MIKQYDLRRDMLPVYEVEELSLEEAMRVIPREKIPENAGASEDHSASAATPS